MYCRFVYPVLLMYGAQSCKMVILNSTVTSMGARWLGKNLYREGGGQLFYLIQMAKVDDLAELEPVQDKGVAMFTN